MNKTWTLLQTDEEKIRHLARELDVKPVIARLLVQRGITNYEQAKEFFLPSLDRLHDPFLMEDMDKATDRIITALEKKEKILLYGDYDVDGTTCVALLHRFLEKIGYKNLLSYYIPDRYREGYGISRKGIEAAHKEKTNLIISMDCGIQAIEEIELANQMEMDVIICDHHLPSEQLPRAVAILDPKRKDCGYPYKELSGCGVVFKLVQALSKRLDLPEDIWHDLLDLLVMSIGCDIVKMTGENRILAHFGLQQINKQQASLGLKTLIEKSNRNYPVSISDLIFGSGPMINAAGRLADAKEAVRLFLSKDPSEAAQIAESLYLKNNERKEFERNITKEAIKLWEQEEDKDDRRTIVLYSPNWHKGVLGIAASKLVEKFHRPTIIMVEQNDILVGSARSIPGFDIHEALVGCAELFSNFGGHQYAAGLSMKKKNLDTFKIRLEKIAQENILPEDLQPEIQVSADLDFEDISPKFLKTLQRFAPFGPGNRRPVFRTKGVKDSGYSRIVKDEHLKLHLSQKNSRNLDGIGFYMSDFFEKIKDAPFDICYVLEENHWKGKRSISLNLKGLK